MTNEFGPSREKENREEHEPSLRNQAISVYKIISGQGVKDPNRVDPLDENVITAKILYDYWVKFASRLFEGDEEGVIRFHLSRDIFFVDAGFTDKIYLEHVLSWLRHDLMLAKAKTDNPERIETLRLITRSIKKVKNILKKQLESENNKKGQSRGAGEERDLKTRLLDKLNEVDLYIEKGEILMAKELLRNIQNRIESEFFISEIDRVELNEKLVLKRKQFGL